MRKETKLHYFGKGLPPLLFPLVSVQDLREGKQTHVPHMAVAGTINGRRGPRALKESRDGVARSYQGFRKIRPYDRGWYPRSSDPPRFPRQTAVGRMKEKKKDHRKQFFGKSRKTNPAGSPQE